MPTKRSPNITWAPRPENAIQFKVTLRYIRPPIWRRVMLPDNYSLGDLHAVIQAAMGWQNCHLHSFQIGDVCYTSKDASEMEDMDMEREDRVRLKELGVRPKQKFMYEYDFGDSWEHEIVVEKNREEYYERLLAVSRDGAWTPWCAFFLKALQSQAEDNQAKAQVILNLYQSRKAWIAELTRSQYGIHALDFERPSRDGSVWRRFNLFPPAWHEISGCNKIICESQSLDARSPR